MIHSKSSLKTPHCMGFKDKGINFIKCLCCFWQKEMKRNIHVHVTHLETSCGPQPSGLWLGSNAVAEQLCYFIIIIFLSANSTYYKNIQPGQKMHRRSSFENKIITKKQIIQNQENCNNPVSFAHFCYTINTQWSQNEMTSFTIFMAFLFAFLHNIQPFFNFSSFFFFSIQGRGKKAYVQ